MNAWGWHAFTLLTVPKSASTAVAHAMAARGVAMCASSYWMHRPEPSVLVIREPVERALSCFRFFSQRDKGWPAGTPAMPTFAHFLTHVEACARRGAWNQHWQPQVDQVPHFDFAVPLDRLPDLWAATIGGDIPVDNASEPQDIALSKADERLLRSLYISDVLAYKRAQEQFDSTLEALT